MADGHTAVLDAPSAASQTADPGGPEQVRLPLSYRAPKRAIDIAAASILLILCLPVLAVAAVVVKASGLPLLFRQERVGRNGKLFTVYKLDTMRRAAFEICVQWEDDRVPKACRWLRTTRVDELPQLWNILRGDMSLVGPRPLPLAVVEEARSRPDYAIRELAAPGLASWAKVRSPNGHFQVEEQMLLDDVYSIRRASLRFDLKVILLTPYAVWRGLSHFRATAKANASAEPAAVSTTS